MDFEGPTTANRFDLLRVEPGHDFHVELLSGKWFRLGTHFVGRTVLCAGESDCALCELLPMRSFWYLPAKPDRSSRVVLLELSAFTSGQLEQGCKFAGYGVGPGVRVRFSRRSKRASVACELLERGQTLIEFPARVWVSGVMAVFGMPAWREDESCEAYSARTAGLAAARNRRWAENLRLGKKVGA